MREEPCAEGCEERIRKLAVSYQECRALMAGVRLGVFDTLAVAPGTAAEAADRLGCLADPLTLLLDALAAMGLLLKEGGRYACATEAARLLADGSRETLAPLVRHQERMVERWARLEEIVRGRPEDPDPGQDLRDFAGAMAANGRRGAERVLAVLDLAGVRRLLDLGGGPGSYAAAFARRWPEMEVTLFDQEATVAIAAERLAAEGLAGRVRLLGGDLFSGGFGDGYDAIWASNLIHSFPPAGVRTIIGLCRRALAPGGRLLLHDFLLDADRTAPRRGAVFSLHMLVATGGGRSYSFEETEAMLAAGGFAGATRLAATETSGVLVATRTPG